MDMADVARDRERREELAIAVAVALRYKSCHVVHVSLGWCAKAKGEASDYCF